VAILVYLYVQTHPTNNCNRDTIGCETAKWIDSREHVEGNPRFGGSVLTAKYSGVSCNLPAILELIGSNF